MKTQNTKTENGKEFPASAYAYVPDATKPSTWKLRLTETPEGQPTAGQVGRAIAAVSASGYRGQKADIPTADLPAVKKALVAAWKATHPDQKPSEMPTTLREAVSDDMSFNDIQQAVQQAITAKYGAGAGPGYGLWIRDLSDTWVVWDSGGDGCYQADYTIDGDTVTLGMPQKVEPHTVYQAVEATDHIAGRVKESKGSDDAGGRIFRMDVIAAGDSKNRRRYTEAVLGKAAGLYEGAKVYDHHRTAQELETSTIAGLVGSLRNVEATSKGIEADLHLLPGAAHTAEALDASLQVQDQGLPPLVGMSHDVQALFVPLMVGGQRFQECTEITKVHSADVVADPSAGGKATRMVAGGTGDDNAPEEGHMTLKELLALLREAKDRAGYDALVDEHKTVLTDAGLTSEDFPYAEPAKALAGVGAAAAGGAAGAPGGDAGAEGGQATEATRPEPGRATETSYAKSSPLGSMLVSSTAAAGLAGTDPETARRLTESFTRTLPDRFTESELMAAWLGFQGMRKEFERAGLAPSVPHVQVTRESLDKKIAGLDAMFAGDFRKGYTSFKRAYYDITGHRPPTEFGTEDEARAILRECIGAEPYDGARRATESATASTWNLILGDSITRRLVAEYNQPSLQTWRAIVSNVFPLNDFRTQRIDRLGGYGVLPTVNEGAPYQPLTTPGNEEVTYSPSKRGGTEDLTYETIVNDDLRVIQKIPQKLGLAAAQTLYRFVWDFLNTNPTVYDSVALFASGHANTDTNALSGANVSVGRKKMRKQTAYGDSNDVLSIVPKTLVVCSDLEELAFEIATSAVALPSAAPVGAATNIPNLHANLDFITVDYWTSTTAWFLVADPAMVPTIEIGFLFGKQDPELFVQNDPTVGSPFNADKITWKIRHIYGGADLDYRGFYRGNS